MELPAILPQELNYLSKTGSARELFELLLKTPPHFILFFEAAAEDETWSERHHAFTQLSLQWFTNQFFENRLPVKDAKRIVDAIHSHFSILSHQLPNDVVFRLRGESFEENSLLWGVASVRLREQILYECRDKQKFDLELQVSSFEAFQSIEEFVNTGICRQIGSKEEREIMEILQQASEWEIAALSEECQKLLVKYIDDSSVLKYLLTAHGSAWLLLRNACNHFINSKELGVRLEDTTADEFSFEFLDFRKSAIEFFDKVRQHVTQLVCRFQLINEELFSVVVHRCPRMKGLSVSESESFSDRLLDLPEGVERLDLSKCSWLNHNNLRAIFEHSSFLTELCLSSNAQLNYTDWATLKHLRGLIDIDISSCPQVSDQDLKVILQACPSLKRLNLDRCSGLSDLAFFELACFAPRLDVLSLAKCRIFDAGLIDLATKCRSLSSLNLKGCSGLSDRGVIETVRNARNLQSLCLEGCNMSIKTIMTIQALRPNLKVMF